MNKILQLYSCIFVLVFIVIGHAGGQFSDGLEGDMDCQGSLRISHGPNNDPYDDIANQFIYPGNYRRIRNIRQDGENFLRGRTVLNARVSGSCYWIVFPRLGFRGDAMILEPGFDSYLDFSPKSLKSLMIKDDKDE